MAESLMADFLVNQAADTLILFMVRQRLFPEISPVRICTGGVLASSTYCLWNIGRSLWSGWLPGPFLLLYHAGAVLSVSLIFAAVFPIRSAGILLSAWRQALVSAFCTGGAVTVISSAVPVGLPFKNLAVLLFWAAACLLFSPLLLKKDRSDERRREGLYQVEIVRNGRRIRCTGLYDSGNLLVSRLTGEGICVITQEEGRKLLNEEEKVFLSSGNRIPKKDMHLIRYHCLTGEEEEMAGFLADRIIISKEGKICASKSGMVGICRRDLTGDRRFTALLPADIFGAGIPAGERTF